MKNLTTPVKQFCLFIGAAFLLIGCNAPDTKKVEQTVDEFFKPETSGTKTSYYWPSQSRNLVFPEDALNLTKTGICMSGGGTRAMVCAIGQLAGLQKIGLLDDVGYLSCVSGGSWASVPYIYNNSAISDEELLGTIVDPGTLTIDNMYDLDPNFIAGRANQGLLATMIEDLGSVNVDDIWINGVGKSYMAPYGLYDTNSPKYFSYDAATVAQICASNPTLSPDDFITVASGDFHRPYLVVNSSITGPFQPAPYNTPQDLAVFNYTPLGVGTAMPLTATYTPEVGNAFTKQIGGGFIQPFAFGGSAPTTVNRQCAANQYCYAFNSLASTPFSIADASGTSSSAFVAEFTEHGIDGYSLKDLSPEESYFPFDGIVPTSETYIFGDGGNLENLGAISLLQRNVNKLVIFVNTDTELNENFNVRDIPGKDDVSSDILTLFGIQFSGSENMNRNQVFPTDDIKGIMNQFCTAKNNGKSIIANSTHTTVANNWWGIPAGRTVTINWVYNDSVEEFAELLEFEIREPLLHANGYPLWADFPRYATIDADIAHLVELTGEKINLLYQFSAWNVYSNPNAFTALQ